MAPQNVMSVIHNDSFIFTENMLVYIAFTSDATFSQLKVCKINMKILSLARTPQNDMF